MGAPETFPNLVSGKEPEKNEKATTEKITIKSSDDIILVIQEKLPRLTTFAMNLCDNNADEADELYQSTIVRIFENKEKFTPGSNFKGRTYTIMRNIFINNYRKEKKTSQISLDHANSLPSESIDAESSMNEEQLLDYIKSLDPGLRIPFELYFEGFQYQEIADILGVPLGTVKSRIFFARKKLKELVERSDPELVELYTSKKNKKKAKKRKE